ncbi:hypothetical protein V1264_013658 [Littorina saxatilis]|uniref:BRCA1-associated RING domain protein 1 n=2 Tax=Littorina saxatilis TaxID=31220 RepID=A0AAN9BQ32_9CAEN
MDLTLDISGFESTKAALASLQRLLFCCQCSQLTKNVCTLGNCEHFFCKQCVEERLGARCPVCGTPAHAKDAQVNRQLSNIVSLSVELERLLKADSGSEFRDTGPQDIVSSLNDHDLTPERHRESPHGTATSLESPRKAEEGSKATSPSPGRSAGKRLSHKVAHRKGRKEANEATLTQLCSGTNSCDTDEESFKQTPVRSTASPFHFQKKLTPQTRVRSKRLQSGPQTKQNENTHESNFEDSTLSKTFINEKLAAAKEVCYADEKMTTASPMQQVHDTPQRRGRRKKQVDAKGMLDQTSSSPLSSGSRSRSQRGSVSSSHPAACETPTSSPVSTPYSCSNSTPRRTPRSTPKTSLRRKSAPETPNSRTPRSVKSASKSERKFFPSTPSPAQGTRPSPVSNSSAVKRTNRRSMETGSGSNGVRMKRNAKGETPLHVAAIKGDLSAVKELMSKGDNPNVRDNAGWTPLHEAVNHGNAGVTEVLLQHGALVNTPGMENDTPLHDAVTNNRLECVRLLIAYGASVTARNVHGKTAMELAKIAEMKDALQQPALHRQHISNLPEPEDAEEFLPLCLLGTALSRDQRGLLQKCATKLHARVVEEYTAEVTHVISSVNADGQCPRTTKYLQAVLGGKWIVSVDWITICLEYGEKVSEEPFEIPGSSTHPNSHAAHEARINRRLQLPPLFDGCQVYLHGSFTRMPPSKQELTELLRLGGAHFLTREPRLTNLDEYEVTVPYHAKQGSSLVDCGIFIVHDGGSNVPRVEAQRMRVVPASWVVACIATFSLVEPSSLAN